MHCTGYVLLPSSPLHCIYKGWHIAVDKYLLVIGLNLLQYVSTRPVSWICIPCVTRVICIPFVYPRLPFVPLLMQANHNNGADEAEFWQKAGLCTI